MARPPAQSHRVVETLIDVPRYSTSLGVMKEMGPLNDIHHATKHRAQSGVLRRQQRVIAASVYCTARECLLGIGEK